MPTIRAPMHSTIPNPHDFDAFAGDRVDAAPAAGCSSHVPLGHLRSRIDQLHAPLESGARVVMLDNAFVSTSNISIHRREAEGNTSGLRTIDDRSPREVARSFPPRDKAVAALGPRAGDMVRWQPTCHRVLSCTLA